MKLLIILAQYHPALNPNVYRWRAIANHWIAQGHEVHVLCTKRSGLPDETAFEGVQVHRAGQNSLLDWAYNLLHAKRRRGESGGDLPARHGVLRKGLEKLVDATWRSLYWPDGRCLWYWPGRKRALKLLQTDTFNGIITVGAPFTAHLIGLACKRAQPELPWLVDIEDPFAFVDAYFINNRLLYRRLNFHAEALVLNAATAITVTVDTAKEAYEHYFPGIGSKITVVPPLFDPTLVMAPGSDLFDSRCIHIAYFGAFYAPIRTPDAALNLLDLLLERYPELKDRLLIHFFGEIEYAVKAAFDRYPRLLPNLRLHGLVEREQVASAMAQTTFLLNIGNTTTYNLPSKSADYLASGKPIIHLSASEPDTFVAFMAEHPMMLRINTQTIGPEAADALGKFIADFQNQHLSAEAIAIRIKSYQTAPIADAYFRLLEKMNF
ncbi:MAG: glycosyltransferase [Saprospiraceae bacterium]|nr:glycosyltransferase [Saprospiraceae bacterium]